VKSTNSTYYFNGFCLRPFEPEDCLSLAYYANNKDIANNLRDVFPHPYTLQDANDWIHYATTQNNDLLLALVVNNDVVGSIGAVFKTDVYRLNAEIGFWLNPAYWNKGMMTQALQFIVNHLFETSSLERIYAHVFSRNLASQRVLQKCGFKLEAKLERAVIKNGIVMDELVFGLLRPSPS
jgi:RimJ/RimL family protein N-acetyltransferase